MTTPMSNLPIPADIPIPRPVGRPRTVSPPPEELENLGQEMLDWVSKNNPIHLSEWYSFQKFYTENAWKTMIVRPEFVGYYETALKMVGIKYLKKDSNIDSSVKHRWQRVYFKDLKEEEDETAKYNVSIKAESDGKGNIVNVNFPNNSAAYNDGQIRTPSISKENT
jgi:hypothetical protein